MILSFLTFISESNLFLNSINLLSLYSSKSSFVFLYHHFLKFYFSLFRKRTQQYFTTIFNYDFHIALIGYILIFSNIFFIKILIISENFLSRLYSGIVDISVSVFLLSMKQNLILILLLLFSLIELLFVSESSRPHR